MASSDLSLPGGLRTPLEPIGRQLVRRDPPALRHALHTTAFGRIEAAVASSCGTQHPRNEDAASPLGGASMVFVVADGVGGGAMAELASRELVRHLHDALETRRVDADAIGQAMLDADRAIALRIAGHTERPGAATVVLVAPANVFVTKWLVGWVGDCRAYRVSPSLDGGIALLTLDDTFRNLGETPPPGGSPDDPARMVGNGATLGANVAAHELACGDVLALCSDGVHKHLGAGDWRRVLSQQVSLVQRADDLVAVARANGSADDATVLLVERTARSLPGPAWMRAGRRAGDAGSAR